MVLGLDQLSRLAPALEGDVIQLLDRDFEFRRIQDRSQSGEEGVTALEQYPVAEALASCILSLAISRLSGSGFPHVL